MATGSTLCGAGPLPPTATKASKGSGRMDTLMDSDRSRCGLDVLGLWKEVLASNRIGSREFNGGAYHLQEDVWTMQPELEDISPALDSLEPWCRENMWYNETWKKCERSLKEVTAIKWVFGSKCCHTIFSRSPGSQHAIAFQVEVFRLRAAKWKTTGDRNGSEIRMDRNGNGLQHIAASSQQVVKLSRYGRYGMVIISRLSVARLSPQNSNFG